mmetsp:Transcript_5055/g.13098  ORF Transcript_5055/g.13098 Transcript_5055/m.13098 type:complete len:217 (+) Transcript_5055:476-1126(+)
MRESLPSSSNEVASRAMTEHCAVDTADVCRESRSLECRATMFRCASASSPVARCASASLFVRARSLESRFSRVCSSAARSRNTSSSRLALRASSFKRWAADASPGLGGSGCAGASPGERVPGAYWSEPTERPLPRRVAVSTVAILITARGVCARLRKGVLMLAGLRKGVLMPDSRSARIDDSPTRARSRGARESASAEKKGVDTFAVERRSMSGLA